MKVRDVMTDKVISVHPETPLKEVARSLAEHGISGVPVVDDDNRVLGVVSEADFLLKEQDQPQPGRSLLFSWVFDREEGQRVEAKLHATTAGACMSRPAITVETDRGLREAAALMTRHGINRLPVVDDGRLVGIVTRADLVGTFLVPDEDLRARITDEVLRETLWLEPDEVRVSVTDGVARLDGTVDRRSTATILERLVSQVDGVVGVESALGWDLDDRKIAPVGDLEREPTAASVTSRERPRR
ncbi:MAG TPA: CBS domain-containing protein [Candidatus Limnocylindrales bacterium]|nr:CBS domain-containing protein [Candidatus Limnocylindrales bacterium]